MADCAESEVVYNDYVCPILNLLAAISTIPFIFVYIRAYLNKRLQSRAVLFYLALVLFCLISISFTMAMVRNLVLCLDELHSLSNFMNMTTGILYTTQSIMVIIILFIRLIHIFEGTALALSRTLINLFIASVTIMAISSATCAISYNLLEEYSSNGTLIMTVNSLWALTCILYIIFLVCLNGVFVKKMHTVFHGIDTNKNEKMKNLICKTTVLCMVSSMTIVAFMIPFFTSHMMESPHIVFVSDIMFIADLYTNFLSILMAYNYFDVYYMRLCGFCDKMGRRYVGGQTKDTQMIEKDLDSAGKEAASMSKSEVAESMAVSRTNTDSVQVVLKDE